MIKVAILTVSDSCAAGKRKDLSGQTIEQMLAGEIYQVCEKKITPDDRDVITAALKRFSDEVGAEVVLTTGGTGFGPRDVTPEATAQVCDRLVPGISEVIRAEGREKTKKAVLSRGLAGIRDKTLIINLPGSPKGVKESLEIILDVLGHAVDMLRGGGH